LTFPLQVSGLYKSFNGRVVLDGVSFDVPRSSITGLLGPNGAGKTTAFKLILGLETADAGTVHFGGNLGSLPLYRRAQRGLGYLPQTPTVFTGLSTRDNLIAILQTLKKPCHRADTLLARFGLTHLSRQKASTLSGGERRRLEFARALCSDPAILLVDEPFTGVDPIAAQEICRLMAQLVNDGIGILLTDHSVHHALDLCDQIHLLVSGRIVESGNGESIRVSETAKRLYLGNNG